MQIKNHFPIGQVSKMCHINPKTLRYYDRIGLVVPSYKNAETGYRYYTQEDIFAIVIVKKLQSLEFSLKDIVSLFQEEDLHIYKASITQKIKDLENKILSLQMIAADGITMLDKIALLHSLDETPPIDQPENHLVTGMYNIQVEEVPEQMVLSIVKEVPSYSNSKFSVGRWLEVIELAKKEQLKSAGSITLTYHTDQAMGQFFQSNCTLEVALPIVPNHTSTCKHLRTVPAHKAVTFLYCGDYKFYSNFMNVHASALQWIDRNGYQVNGYVSEEYILSPMDFKSVGTYITKIYFPIL